MGTPIRITASEFRQHFGTYMKDVATTDFEVTRNGRVIGLWTDPSRNRIQLVDRLDGCLPGTLSDDEASRILDERIMLRADEEGADEMLP